MKEIKDALALDNLIANENYQIAQADIEAARAIIDIQVVQTDVTTVSQIDQFGTRFDRHTGQFSMMTTWTNIGDEQCSEPLHMVIESITPPSTVTCANEDGTTPEGKPYYDYSDLVGDGILEH